MYYQYFGLREAPFSIAVNPRYLFMSPRHRDALAHLLYGVGAGGGFILLTGEVGTGKTTINRCLLEQLPDATDVAIVLNPALNALELLATVCDELGIEHDRPEPTLKSLTDSLHRFLLANHQRGRSTVLLIDEAQHLEFEVLEQIRLLTNLETNSQKLLQIILIGQPELAHMLGRPELRQLNQRITARYNLEPLNLAETGAYIRHRLQVAGLSPGRELFPPGVVRGIHRRTRGIPRLINVLCDRMLLGAYGRDRGRADTAMLRQAATEVMGPEETKRRWPAWSAALAALLLVALGGWWLLERGGDPLAEQSTVMVQAPRAPAVVPPQPVVPPVTAAPVAEPVAAAAPTTAPATAGEEAQRAWLLPPRDAMSRLWSLYSTEPAPAEPCAAASDAGLACIEGRAQTWEELARLDRPLVLEMVTPERFAAAALYLGGEGRDAWLWTPQGARQVDLTGPGPLWSGGYRMLWHPPAGFSQPLGLGDQSEVVARVAGLFARLDGQAQPLAVGQFNASLRERVRLFQRRNGLEDDGVVGQQTLMGLNQALGIDPTAAAARQRLAADGEVVAR